MPRIRLLAQANVGGQTRFRGQECDVPADVAQSLVSLSRAELVAREQPETPEGPAGRADKGGQRRTVERR